MRPDMIKLIDKVECDALERSVVKPDALRRAVLVQDAGAQDRLFALLMIDETRAVLVAQGGMNLAAVGGSAMQKLQAFRNQLYRAGVRSQELRFCVSGAYAQALEQDRFDASWFVAPTFPELVARYQGWRAGKAVW
jgi:hypothetical protein